MKKLILSLLLALSFAMTASAQQPLGTYKLVSFKAVSDDGTSSDFFGANPQGYVVITPKRFITILVSGDRQSGKTADEKVALFNSLIAYTGPYTIEGSKLITAVDVSWNQTWTGTKQGRTWNVEGNQLILLTDKAPSIKDPSRLGSARLVWEKIE